MQVNEIMSQKPEYISPNTNLTDAATRMRDHHFGFIPIGENDKLIGIVTDRDIAIRAVANGNDPTTTPVSEIMTEKVLYCFEDDDVKDAVKNMREQHVHRLIVLNNRDNKHITGILSLSDLAQKCEDKTLSWEVACCASEKAA